MTPSSRPSLFAKNYARLAPQMDARGVAEHRAELVAGLAGSVVEVGCGPGGMFRHYPPAVTSVLAVESDAYFRDLAIGAADDLNGHGGAARVAVVAGDADALPVSTGSADAVVFSLVLCSVPDPAAALAETRRVLKPGGVLRFYEHVRSDSRILGLLEDAITPLWRRAAANCHPNRDTVATIRAAGFEVEAVRRFGFAPAPIAPGIAHVIGSARRA